MDDLILGMIAAQPDSFAATPYLRGLADLLHEERLAYILARTRRGNRRRGRVLSSSVVWLVVAMSLFASHSIPMVWRSLHPYSTTPDPDDSTFTYARQRLGVAPLRELFHIVAPCLAPEGTPGAFYRSWRLMGIDGTILNIPDTPKNERIFGRGGNQRSPNAFPQVRVLALCELGTHVICDFALRPVNHSEQHMVPHLMPSLQPGMLLLWDRGFFGFDLITNVLARGCHLLARLKASQLIFERGRDLPDGSYLSHIYPSCLDRRQKQNGRLVRIIEYTHDDPARAGCGQRNRLLTDLLDPADLPAQEAPVLYHQRWEEELVFDEIKTHLNGRDVHLRSKTPRGVVQELYGLFLAHRIVRQVMSDAASLPQPIEPARLSFTDSLRIIQSHLHEAPTCSTEVWYQRLTEEVRRQTLRSRRERWYPRVIKQKLKKWPTKRACHRQPPQPSKTFADSVLIT